MIFHQKNRRPMKHPLLGPSETHLHFQLGGKKGEIHHHTHLEGDEWPLPKPRLHYQTSLRKTFVAGQKMCFKFRHENCPGGRFSY